MNCLTNIRKPIMFVRQSIKYKQNHRIPMETQHKSENTNGGIAPEVRRFMKILSVDQESGNLKEVIHEYKDSKPSKKYKSSYNSFGLRETARCVNCGRESKYLMYCSTKCESEIFGINL